MAVAAAACGVSASQPAPGSGPAITQQTRSQVDSITNGRWGGIVRWQLGGADWSIELPEGGAWDLGESFDPLASAPGNQLISATYRSSTANTSEPSIFVDIVRLELSTLPQPRCSTPTIVSPDGELISTPRDDLTIDGHPASVTRISSPAANGSTTGTYQLCFVTPDAMYQLIAGARPGSAEPDMFAMLTSFRVEN